MSEEILTVGFGVTETDPKWSEYGITEKHLSYQENKTNFKAIIKEDKLVTLVKNRYTVIPNELILEDIVPLIERFGYDQLDSPAKKSNGNRLMLYFVKPELHNLSNNEGIKLGLLLKNSIDGSLSLGVEGFSYRELCSNGVIMGQETVQSFHKKHVGNAEEIINRLEESVALVNKTSLRILEKYKHMTQVKFENDRYESLKENVPRKLLIGVSSKIEQGTDWNAYNEITQNLWHNKKVSQMGQYGLMKTVNRVFEV